MKIAQYERRFHGNFIVKFSLKTSQEFTKL